MNKIQTRVLVHRRPDQVRARRTYNWISERDPLDGTSKRQLPRETDDRSPGRNIRSTDHLWETDDQDPGKDARSIGQLGNPDQVPNKETRIEKKPNKPFPSCLWKTGWKGTGEPFPSCLWKTRLKGTGEPRDRWTLFILSMKNKMKRDGWTLSILSMKNKM